MADDGQIGLISPSATDLFKLAVLVTVTPACMGFICSSPNVRDMCGRYASFLHRS
jgi:hypothetical protein